MTWRPAIAVALATLATLSTPARAQALQEAAVAPSAVSIGAPEPSAPYSTELTQVATELTKAAAEPGALGAAGRAMDQGRLSTAVEIAVLLTVLTLLPAILITVTSFTRIVIVLSFVRRALSTNELPPTQVILGLSLFLTLFVMAPVAERIHAAAWKPYRAEQIDLEQAGARAWSELGTFLVANTRQSEIALFADMAHWEAPQEDARPPLRVVVPAFVLSELKTSFQMGFLLFLPFLVIDMVVASVLLSMGMFMLPPVMISTPFKILLFVLVDGWHLVCESLVTSFASGVT